MQKVGNDEWYQDRIISRFKMKIVQNSFENKTTIHTAACGLGWRFGVSRGSYGNNSIIFDGYCANSEMGAVTVEAVLQSENGEHLSRESRSFGKPERGSYTLMAPNMGQLSDCILVITVWFKIRLDIPNVKPASVPLSIQNLLTHSLRDGAFIDTKFFVFSKRSESGRVGFPMPLYANSTLLQDKSAYFETLLSDHGFSESANVDIQSPFPANEEPFVDTYDYDSDSDLEVTEDEITPSLSRAAPSSVVRSVSSPRRTRPNEDSERSSTTKGKIIVIKDIAYNTWQSLLFFIYTGDIGFLPLTSERSRSRAEFLEKYYHDYPHRPPPCSPKSMYRLAEKLGFDELEKLAFDAIRVSVSEENIMEEAFSKFTARYRRVLEMQAELLHESYKSPKVLDAIPEKLREIVEGDAPHTLDIITTLFNNLAAH